MSTITLEVSGYCRGRQFIDKKIEKVRVDDAPFRPASSPDFHAALQWLSRQGYEFDHHVGPGRRIGTGTARYYYRKGES